MPTQTAVNRTTAYQENTPEEAVFQLDWGVHTLLRLLSSHTFDTVLDIGSGTGEHKRFLEIFGKRVYSVDVARVADYVGDFMDCDFDGQFDVIWCSHVLEHQRNVGLFLDKIFRLLPDNGILALTVPYHPRERLISGHLSCWSIPLLCYNLIMAGFDCSQAQIFISFELGLLIRKRQAKHTERDRNSAHGADAGREFDEINRFFPFDAFQGADVSGNMANWGDYSCYCLPHPVCGDTVTIRSKNLQTYQQFMPKLQFSDATPQAHTPVTPGRQCAP